MPFPLSSKVLGGLLEAHPATLMTLDALQHLINARAPRQPAQFTRQVLLQRLAALLGPALQSGVHVVGDVADQQVRHACIMLSPTTKGQAPRRP